MEENLTLVCGTISSGKSSKMLDMALKKSKNKSVLFITNEFKHEELEKHSKSINFINHKGLFSLENLKEYMKEIDYDVIFIDVMFDEKNEEAQKNLDERVQYLSTFDKPIFLSFQTHRRLTLDNIIKIYGTKKNIKKDDEAEEE